MVALNKNSAVPLYEQLKVELTKLIVSGAFKSRRDFYSLSEIVGKYNVSQITARRVIDELAAEGYLKTAKGKKPRVTTSRTRNDLSRMLKVAIFFYSESNAEAIEYDQMPWTNMIFSGLQEKLLEKNALWSMVPAASSNDALLKLAQLQEEHDAFICLSPSIEEKLTGAFEKLRKPYVIIQPYKEERSYNFVAADSYRGSMEMAERAVLKNYKSFLYLFKDKDENPEKLRGFQEALLRKDIPPQNIHIRIAGSDSEEKVAGVFEDFIKEQDKAELLPLAVYSFGDRLSMRVVSACSKLGLRVPEDVGVAGSTGMPEAEHCVPPLTTIQIPMRKMGNAAAEMIFEMLSVGNCRLPGVKLDVKLVKRASL